MNVPLNTAILGVAALLIVVALFALTVWVFKSIFGGSGAPKTRGGREKRLGVVETAAVDANRKLYLVRRDHVEHLLIIGGPVDVVIEAGIQSQPQMGYVPTHPAQMNPAPASPAPMNPAQMSPAQPNPAQFSPLPPAPTPPTPAPGEVVISKNPPVSAPKPPQT